MEGQDDVVIDWCRDPALAEPIARFFVDNADPAYISHGEIMFGRALGPGQWAGDLFEQVAAEARAAVDDPSESFAVALLDGAILALAEVSFVDRHGFAVLNDVLVSRAARGMGLGQRLLNWIEDECRKRGIKRLFLESGIGNDRAHEFFEHRGFVKTAVTMMREL